jgi:MinD-like ATPase involved in chromosome partitioning or flagellar assembly
VTRQAIVVALPGNEWTPVSAQLNEAGFETIRVTDVAELEAVVATRSDIAVAILDGENDFDVALEQYAVLHEGKSDIPALMIVSQRALDRLSSTVGRTTISDEYLTRPYSVESLRWRIEAMLIRSQTVDDGSGPVLTSTEVDTAAWGPRAQVIVIFNPKGGVGKTTVATNLAAALQLHRNQRVFLIDADTVTGHVSTSLALEQGRTVEDSWRDELEEGPSERFIDLASEHPSGLRVVSLTSSPLHTEILEPDRVAAAITASRSGFDYIIVDMHPSYSPINLAIFAQADTILVPVTPDVPALRAAVQLRDLGAELGIRDKLAMVINRANSGVSVADMERTVGMPALATIRSGGLLFVRAANEGRTVIERYPSEKVSADFDALADRLMGGPAIVPAPARATLRGFFTRVKEPVRT